MSCMTDRLPFTCHQVFAIMHRTQSNIQSSTHAPACISFHPPSQSFIHPFVHPCNHPGAQFSSAQSSLIFQIFHPPQNGAIYQRFQLSSGKISPLGSPDPIFKSAQLSSIQLSSAQLWSAQSSSAQLSSAQSSSAQLSSAQQNSPQLASAQLNQSGLLFQMFHPTGK